jgi:uncharacterized protein YggE
MFDMNLGSRFKSQLQARSLWIMLLLATSVLSISLLQPLMAQEGSSNAPARSSLRTLTVTGQGNEKIPATLAKVSLGVEAQGATANAVQEAVATRSSAVVNLLKTRQVEKLQTTGISLRPDYSYEDGKQQLKGYTATNIVSFQLDAQKIGGLLDESVKAGATRIDSISFMATDSAIAQAQQQALRKATQDAQTQADAVLTTLNFTRKEIVSIQVNGSTPPQPLFADVALQARAKGVAAPSSPVEAGEQEVAASVTLQISY